MSSCPGMMLGGGYPCGKSIGGFFEEFTTRMYRADPPVAQRRTCNLANFGDEVVYDHEYALALLYEMLAQAGVEVLLNHIALEVNVENETIKSVSLVSTEGEQMLVAGTYIDCTGNGDIASRAGVPAEKGDWTGKMMGATLSFFLENVDWEKAFPLNADPCFRAYAERAIREKRIHETISKIYMLRGFRKGSVFFNTVTITGIDGVSPRSILEGTNIARKWVMELVKFVVAEVPGFQNSHLAYLGPQVGIRETRRLEGIYQLTHEDLAAARKFEDGIVACDNPLDNVFRDAANHHSTHEAALSVGSYYTIPFRSLVPKAIRNLLFAGRLICADNKAFSSIRGMPQCMGMGQAAGIGAAITRRARCDVQSIDSARVVKKLRELGVAGIGGRQL